MSLSPSVFARVFVLIAVFASLAACGFEGQTTITRTPHPDLDPTGIDDLLKAIRGERYGQVHSVLLTIDGELVLEAYFHDYSRNQRQALYSVTKSYLSALIGIAIQEGHIQSVDDRVLPYFPEYPDLANVGPEKESLTIEHLLTMTAGFDWNELSRPYDDPLNDYQKYLASNDRVRYVLERPTIQQPGTRVSYNTALSQVLSVILTKAVGMSAAQYAEVKLFGPLGIENWEWSPYDDKTSVGGAGLYLRAVDMAKLGQLYLQNGVWEGRQIVSTDWVQASTASYGTVTQWHDYGYQWWRYSSAAANSYLDGHEGIYYALGRGGQYVWVLPYANAVLSCTAWNDNNGYWPEAMLWEHVGPSIRR